MKRKLSIENSGAIAAVMALMEAPAIVIGVILVQIFIEKREQSVKIPKVIMHSFTNGSVLLILGSLIVGLLQFSQPLYL